MKAAQIKLTFLLVIASVQLHAQTNNSTLSANLMEWMHHDGLVAQGEKLPNAHHKRELDYTLSLLIKVNQGIEATEFSKLQAVVGTKAGNIWTVRIPSKNVKQFTQLKGIDYMEIAQTVHQQTDSARYYANVDSAMKGIGIPMPLTGKGVVMGVIDGGFDYTNPAFYDTTYSKLRISRVWVQNISGTPPTGYTYGAEFKDSSSILQKQHDGISDSHGNACAAIAAGSGVGSKNAVAGRGIAYESELVFVTVPTTYHDWREMNMATIIDAINYIFSYAQSQGKPTIINISMGSLLGARDGGSLFAQACDNLTGPGKILAFGAANQRGIDCHIGKIFSPTDTVLKTLVPINEVDSGEQRNYIDVWGDSLQTFCLQFGMYRNGNVVSNSIVFCLDNTTKDFYVVGSDNDTCFITLTTKSQDYNKKPHATIDVFSKSKDTLCVSAYANNGTVHMWQEYFDESWVTYWGDFVGNGTWATAGDDDYTIGEMGCTKSAITVGASVSKVYWKNLQNQTLYAPPNIQTGKLASYSSKGPTLDNRMKPDITAPGGMIFCAHNSFSASSAPFVVSKFTSPKNGRDYYHAAGQGTSYASPVVAGIVALMLQVNPNLSPQMIKNILYKTAIKDLFTTANPDSSLWGAGKINGYAAIKETILTASTSSIPKNELNISVYPNPSLGNLNIEYDAPNAGYFLVEISNSLGQNIKTEPWQLFAGKNLKAIVLNEEPQGIYFVTITGKGGQMVKRIILK